MPINKLNEGVVLVRNDETIRCNECSKILYGGTYVLYVAKINKYYCPDHSMQWIKPPLKYRYPSHILEVVDDKIQRSD